MKIKRVMLLNPPVFSSRGQLDVNPYPPLGLAYLSASIKKCFDDVEVKVLDCFNEGKRNRVPVSNYCDRVGLSYDKIQEEVAVFKPDFVGVTHQFSRQTEIVNVVLNIAKKCGTRTIVGGSHPTVRLDHDYTSVDYVVLGEGESVITSILKGEASSIARSKTLLDVNTLPLPDWKTVGLEKYFNSAMSHGYRMESNFAPVQTSRGCSANCIFCTAHKLWGKVFRGRSPEHVVNELEWLKNTYNIKEIMFEDDNLTLNKNRSKLIFRCIIEKGLNIKWDTPNGIAVWTLDEELIDLMKESGCYKLNFPLESGSQKVLDKIIHKPVKLNRAKELVRYAKSIGLDVGLFLVIGLPGETKEDIKKSFKLAEDLEIYYPHVSIATPYPGSELYNICLEKGYINNITSDQLHIRTASISTEEWSKADIEKILKVNRRSLRIKGFLHDPVDFFNRVTRKLLQ